MEANRQQTTSRERLNLVRKNSTKKPPVIKQTLTSLYRFAKANPLLAYGNNTQEQEDLGLNKIKLPKSVLLPSASFVNESLLSASQVNEPKSIAKKTKIETTVPRRPLQRSVSVRNHEKPSNKHALKRTNSIRADSKVKENLRPRTTSKQNLAATKKSATKNGTTSSAVESDSSKRKTTRRSLSAEHYDRTRRAVPKTDTKELIEPKQATQSLNDVRKQSVLFAIMSPVREEPLKVTFKTPNAHKRRSRSASGVSATSTPYQKNFVLTPGPNAIDLHVKLQEWLRRNKSVQNGYNHLKRFGFNHSVLNGDDENKENAEDNSSYEDLKISSDCNTPPGIPGIHNYVDNRTVVQEALKDLSKLILQGYPHEQCEAWLGMIRQKYQDLDEEPRYWECRAAIEQTRGNITSAVECLQTAIVQGAEVKTVDHSLEQLLEKFSLLNIDSLETQSARARKDRVRIVSDARKIFKSSIIQFALKERTLKEVNN